MGYQDLVEMAMNPKGVMQDTRMTVLAEAKIAGSKIKGEGRIGPWVSFAAIAAALELDADDAAWMADELRGLADDGYCRTCQGEWLECPAE